MNAMIFVFRRPVRFAEIDCAGVVFFPRVHEYCHEALEALFAELDGGYPRLVRTRELGVPTVRLDTEFRAPLRYGDTACIETAVERVGRSSIAFRHRITREGDGTVTALVRHVVVMARLSTLTPVEVPPDVRALLDRYRGEGLSGVTEERDA